MLIEHWDGKTWKVEKVPSPQRDTGGSLYAISCPSSRACLAVGGVDVVTGNRVVHAGSIVERWNGSDWTYSYPRKNQQNLAVFGGVTCGSAQSCLAVGSSPLVETWNGRSWTRSGAPSGIRQGLLNAVSCSRAGACAAVGQQSTSTYDLLPLVLRESGTSWREETTPVLNDGADTQALFNGVSCTSARSCTAVGVYYPGSSKTQKAVAEQWNGSRWTVQTTPEPASYTTLSSVSCVGGRCVAVGYAYPSATGKMKPLVEIRG